MGTLGTTQVRLWREDVPVGWAKLELQLDAEAENGVSAHIVDPELDTPVEPDEHLEAHFANPLDGVAFLGALDPTRYGKDM